MKEVPTPEQRGFDPERLIQDHQAGVWRYLRALGCDPALADDLAQETFLAVLQRPFDDYNQAATSSYLRRVAHNLLVSLKRREGKVRATENIEQLDVVWEKWAGSDNGDAMIDGLKECLQQLTERARWALEMRFREKRTRAKIAKALEITEHGAKNLMQRAKKLLRTCLDGKLK